MARLRAAGGESLLVSARLYANMALMTLLNLDYQTRTGVMAAAHHGQSV